MRHDEPVVRSYAVTHPTGDVSLPTQPGWEQIIHARSGALVAHNEDGSWTLPPHRALYIPGGIHVRVRTRATTVVRCLYLRSGLVRLPPDITVFEVAGLTRELILEAVARSPIQADGHGELPPLDSAVIALLADRLRQSSVAPLHLPSLVDARSRQLAALILDRPEGPLDDHAAAVPASRRTLERLFRAETGLSPAAWMRRARVLAAVELLAAGTSVTDAAVSVGYASPSSFVAAFRDELGASPRSFMVG